MVTDLNDTYKMMMMMMMMTIVMMMMIRMMKTQNGHNSAKFEARPSRFCMVIDLNETNKMMRMRMRTMMMMMMMVMMMIMMMKTQNGHNSANFEATTSIFCMVIDLNDTYRIMMMMIRMMKT